VSVEVSEGEADVDVVSLGEADVDVVSLGEADVDVVSLGDGDVVVCVAVGEAVVELAVAATCPDTADASAAPGSARVMASSAAPVAAATPAAAGVPAARVTFQDRGKTSPLIRANRTKFSSQKARSGKPSPYTRGALVPDYQPKGYERRILYVRQMNVAQRPPDPATTARGARPR
jgi:hypothetical protein